MNPDGGNPSRCAHALATGFPFCVDARGKITNLSGQNKGFASRRKRLVLLVGAFVTAAALVSVPTAAQAYTTYGWKWRTGDLRIYVATTSGNYRTAINQASANYTASTDANLTNTTAGGPMFTAAQTNEGATGLDGHTDQLHVGGTTQYAHAYLNTHYLAGKPVAQLKVVWLHEMGHGLGLNHVPGKHVMNTSPSTAYSEGLRNLTADEINGINSLY